MPVTKADTIHDALRDEIVAGRRAQGSVLDEAELADGTTVAQILFTEAGDDVVMVSFIGEPAAGSAEFTEMAEAITEEILDELGEDA